MEQITLSIEKDDQVTRAFDLFFLRIGGNDTTISCDFPNTTGGANLDLGAGFYSTGIKWRFFFAQTNKTGLIEKC